MRLAQANLITKTNFGAKLLSLNRKITQNKSKLLLVENELNKLKLLILVILLKKVVLEKSFWLKFTGSCLKQTKISYNHGKLVNIYTVYELGAPSSHILKNCIFGAVTLTKNADIDKYGYSGYGIGFDRRGSFSFPGGGYGQNLLIFEIDMRFSAHIDNKKKTY